MARRIKRTRKRTLGLKNEDLVERAIRFEEEDESAQSVELQERLQRYAKFRQWRGSGGGPTNPWDNASDAAVSDLAAVSLRIKDTLYNAVMTTRPVVVSQAVNEGDKPKQDQIDKVTDHQAFVENGETWLSDLIEAFVDDGHFTAFVPWVREMREKSETRRAPPIPEGELPVAHFQAVLRAAFPEAEEIVPRGQNLDDVWDFFVLMPNEPEPLDVSFFTSKDEGLEMVLSRVVEVFNGPKIIVKDRADVLHPANAANLQVPGPSNPGGASHVLLRDRPGVDEIVRLQRSGFYDEISATDAKEAGHDRVLAEENLEGAQKDTISGNIDTASTPPEGHNTVTRLMVFDTIETGSGTEDVVYWVVKESKMVLRKRRLSEMSPSRIPRRPFAEESYVPVRGRRLGIGVLELGEGIHDLKKQLTDMSIDHGTLSLAPFFFYKPTSTMKPEVIKLFPGEGYPLNDPSRDVHFPTLPQGGQAFAFNMMTVMERDFERLEMVGDLDFGRVPQGKSSALRTVRGMALIAAKGEARPARVLRRFFNGLTQIWALMHELNRKMLPPEKQIRVALATAPGEDAYTTVTRDEIDVPFEFEFTANVFNTSKEAVAEALGELASLYISPIGIQSGVSDAGTVYKLFRDIGKARGQDPDKYINSPAGVDMISAEEAILEIFNLREPLGAPAEGAGLHLQKLQQFSESDDFGHFDPDTQVPLFAQWVETVQKQLQVEARNAELAQAADQGPGQPGAGEAPAGPQEPTQSSAPLQENELADETLPSAGGGGNTGQ